MREHFYFFCRCNINGTLALQEDAKTARRCCDDTTSDDWDEEDCEDSEEWDDEDWVDDWEGDEEDWDEEGAGGAESEGRRADAGCSQDKNGGR